MTLNNITDKKITLKELKVQLALGMVTPMQLFLVLLSMQSVEDIETGWRDLRKPIIEDTIKFSDNCIRIEMKNGMIFIFNKKEEFLGAYFNRI